MIIFLAKRLDLVQGIVQRVATLQQLLTLTDGGRPAGADPDWAVCLTDVTRHGKFIAGVGLGLERVSVLYGARAVCYERGLKNHVLSQLTGCNQLLSIASQSPTVHARPPASTDCQLIILIARMGHSLLSCCLDTPHVQKGP